MADVPDSRHSVHRVSDVATGRSSRLAGVQAHADANLRAAGPLVRRERPLRRRGRRHRVARLAKDAEERVAFTVDVDGARLLERVPEDAVLGREHLAVALVTELAQELRRVLDVTEEKRGRRGDGLS